ncbi:hypothetical protein P7K49_011700 [Saguinus oedipus]|uniref:Uncharacterized protein n=1 Tax=Saguinus oedipus TaxID=9490 RepID=A0ABQ9VSX8_SAGOE|nr:hypothetical protein P7K49_011700 [Saguinus oedipus]
MQAQRGHLASETWRAFGTSQLLFLPDEIPDVYIVERLFSSSLVVVVSYTKPRQMNVYHFKKGTEICNYSYSSNILSIRLNRQVSGGKSLRVSKRLLMGAEEKNEHLSGSISLKQASNSKENFNTQAWYPRGIVSRVYSKCLLQCGLPGPLAHVSRRLAPDG